MSLRVQNVMSGGNSKATCTAATVSHDRNASIGVEELPTGVRPLAGSPHFADDGQTLGSEVTAPTYEPFMTMEGADMKAGYGRNKEWRTIDPVIGSRYVIQPLNPQKKKHRGRVCVLEGLEPEFLPDMGLIRFEDTNRAGKVELADLTPYTGPEVS